MIVITNPTVVANETSAIHALFEEGLELLHIRKPDFTEADMRAFLSKINPKYSNKLVLHDYHYMAAEFAIQRIHLSSKSLRYTEWRAASKSTSSHSIDKFNVLENDFDYAFLSPVYPSISKIGYRSEVNLTEAIKQRTNFKTKLVALGGIDAENIQQTLENGFDNVALLGGIWWNNNPIENFKKCQKIVLSF